MYIVTPLVAGNSTRQWRIVKENDDDKEFEFNHNLGFQPLCLPTITQEASSDDELSQVAIASPCISEVTSMLVRGRMRKESGTAGARAIITISIPMR